MKHQRLRRLRNDLRKRIWRRHQEVAHRDRVIDIDVEEQNPFIFENLDNLKRSEIRYHAQKQQVLSVVLPNMYTILVDWMNEVCDMYHLHRQTLFLSIDYLQRFLSNTTIEIAPEILQLLAVGCLLLASKHEEVAAPALSLDQLVHVTSETYNRQQIKMIEMLILKTLHFSLMAPTPMDFVARYITASSVHDVPDVATAASLSNLTCYLMELAASKADFFDFLPSQHAAAAVMVARITLGLSPWCATFAHYTQYSPVDLSLCAELFVRHLEDPAIVPPALTFKYTRDARYGGVTALIMLPFNRLALPIAPSTVVLAPAVVLVPTVAPL